MVGLAEKKSDGTSSGTTSAVVSSQSSSNMPVLGQSNETFEVSAEFVEDTFKGKYRLTGSSSWLPFEFHKARDEDDRFDGHCEVQERGSVVKVSETLCWTTSTGRLIGKGSNNKFGDFEVWGERVGDSSVFTGFKKYISAEDSKLENRFDTQSNGGTPIESEECSTRGRMKRTGKSPCTSPRYGSLKRTKTEISELGDENESLDLTSDRRETASDMDRVDAVALFANESDAGVDPSEDLLSEFQLLEDSVGVTVDDFMASGASKIPHIISPFQDKLSYEPEPLAVDNELLSPISPLGMSYLVKPSRRNLTPTAVPAPPQSLMKPRSGSSAGMRLSLPQSTHATHSSDSNSASTPAPPSVIVRLSESFEDPLDSTEDGVSVQARRKIRDFVIGLQARHFYPFDASDMTYGLPSYHPLHDRVEVIHTDTDLPSQHTVSPSSKKKSGKSMQGSSSSIFKLSLGSSSDSTSSMAVGDYTAAKTIPGLILQPYQLRHCGTTKVIKGANQANKDRVEHQVAKVEMDGSCFEGDLIGGVRHGKGVAGYFNGCLYVGDFRKGQEHGLGELRDPTGALIYRGLFEHGRISGRGIIYYTDGSVYHGDVREGARHGQGTIWYYDGTVYEGDFVHGMRSGNGTFVAVDGSKFTGEWSNDVRHGKGNLVLADGTTLDGQFKDNHPDGRCSVNFAEADAEYEGNFKDGLKDGRGTYRFRKLEAVYEGRFARDVISGTGTLKLCPDHIIDMPHPTDPNKSEWMIPVDLHCEVRLAHLRAGFGLDGH